jgi:hypothetical protein
MLTPSSIGLRKVYHAAPKETAVNDRLDHQPLFVSPPAYALKRAVPLLFPQESMIR